VVEIGVPSVTCGIMCGEETPVEVTLTMTQATGFTGHRVHSNREFIA
jgi:hypothetical protein